MKNARFLLLALSLLASALLVRAAGTEQPKFEPRRDPVTETSKLFPEIQKEARRINELVLTALTIRTVPSREDFPDEAMARFGGLVEASASEKLGPLGYPKLSGQLAYFSTTLGQGEGRARVLPIFSVMPLPVNPMDGIVYSFTGNEGNSGELSTTASESVNILVSNVPVPTTRQEALRKLSEAIYPYQLNANSFAAYETRLKLLELADEWDGYFTKGRPQTFWDIAATTLIEYRHIQTDRLVGPPPRQWFLLHPNIVIENLQAAPDGKQLGGAVAIEWIGVNWWKQKVPFGVSLSSLYSDRAGVDDVGHGVTLYFANKYCIGWASHGGDNGFFASIDTLKFIDDKKSKLAGYRSQLGKILGR